MQISRTFSTFLFRVGIQGELLTNILKSSQLEVNETLKDKFLLVLLLYIENTKIGSLDELFVLGGDLSQNFDHFRFILSQFADEVTINSNIISLESLNRFGVKKLIESFTKVAECINNGLSSRSRSQGY